MESVTIKKAMLTKVLNTHYCTLRKAKPMYWRPIELVMALFPETHAELTGFSPAIASFCTVCGALWVVVQREGKA